MAYQQQEQRKGLSGETSADRMSRAKSCNFLAMKGPFQSDSSRYGSLLLTRLVLRPAPPGTLGRPLCV